MSVVIMLQGDVVLYVEDDDAYAEVMACVLKQSGFNLRMIHLSSGEQAKAYLTGVGEFKDRNLHPLPALILCDLKMPGMTGLEFLEWLRAHPMHYQIPFVILTSSEDIKDVTKGYQLGANTFLVKPPTIADLIEMLRGFKKFWLNNRKQP